MTATRTPISAQVEDTTFPFGGYWKGTAFDAIEGDGIRISADPIIPTLLVEGIDHSGDEVTLFLSIRSVHIAKVISDAFHRPVEGMSDDSGLHSLTLPADHPIWVRL